MSRQRLEFQPEPVEKLRERYPRALEELIDVESVAMGLRYDPGVFREHVFDLEEGIRFIISREDQGEEGEMIHLSASINLMGEYSVPVFRTRGDVREFADFCERRFREISNDSRYMIKHAVTEGLIFHWFIKNETK